MGKQIVYQVKNKFGGNLVFKERGHSFDSDNTFDEGWIDNASEDTCDSIDEKDDEYVC